MRTDVIESRRRALRWAAAGAAILAGCGGAARVREAPSVQPLRTLVPLAQVHGGFESAHGLRLGGRPGPFLALRAPVAVAARDEDLYIADAGYDAVFRFDLATQGLRRLPGLAAPPGIRLAALADHSLLVLDGARARLWQVTREGRPVASLRLETGARDLAVDERRGEIWLLDGSAARLLLARPALAAIVPQVVAPLEHDFVGQLTALAFADGNLYALEPARGRVVQLDAHGRVLKVFGGATLRLPQTIAADRLRRVYVGDAFEQQVRLFRDGEPVATVAAPELGALEITDLRIGADTLAIADRRGARVVLHRVLRGGEGP